MLQGSQGSAVYWVFSHCAVAAKVQVSTRLAWLWAEPRVWSGYIFGTFAFMASTLVFYHTCMLHFLLIKLISCTSSNIICLWVGSTDDPGTFLWFFFFFLATALYKKAALLFCTQTKISPFIVKISIRASLAVLSSPRFAAFEPQVVKPLLKARRRHSDYPGSQISAHKPAFPCCGSGCHQVVLFCFFF